MSNNNTKGGLFKGMPLRIMPALILAIFAGGAILWFGKFKPGNEVASELATFTAKRGPLTISVTESGTIKARDQVILKSQVEGRTSIITLIPEGTRVKKGDLLVELDVSNLLDNKIDQEIRVQNAEAAHISAKENFAVVENQAESDIDKAHLTLEFAKLDLKKYLDGEYPNKFKEATGRITLAEEELARVQETLKWSTTLFAEKYISQTELKADELAESKRKLDLELAQSNLELLEDFTYKRDLAQLESDVHQAEMALERTNRKARADVIQAQADLKAREAEYRRQKDKLEKIEDQIGKAKIYAPADGLAIYATSARRGGWRGSREPLDEGQDVHERQELIYLPTATSAKAEVDIHESSMEKVRLGLSAVITVEALPGKKFLGTVATIAPLPDAQSMWMNPDLKVYNTDIYLDANDSSLRTGMSCRAEIIIEQYDDVVYIPVQAVLRVGGETTVYVVNGKQLEPRGVEIGLDNNRMVRIISGLAEGEVVSLTPPLKSAAVEPMIAEAVTETIPVEEERMRKESEDTSSEGREKMRAGFENMSAEERKKMRARFENMSAEDREKMRQERRKRQRQTGDAR
jgi:HlyD family secretion protein